MISLHFLIYPCSGLATPIQAWLSGRLELFHRHYPKSRPFAIAEAGLPDVAVVGAEKFPEIYITLQRWTFVLCIWIHLSYCYIGQFAASDPKENCNNIYLIHLLAVTDILISNFKIKFYFVNLSIFQNISSSNLSVILPKICYEMLIKFRNENQRDQQKLGITM